MRFDKTFFERHQGILLRVANSRWASWLLGADRLPKDLKGKRLVKITPNSIHWDTDKGRKGAFFTRPRFAEALGYNLNPLIYFQGVKVWRLSPAGILGAIAGLLMPKLGWLGFAGTTKTDFAIGIDGEPSYSYSASWATAHDATVGTAVSITGTEITSYVRSRSTDGQYSIHRGILTFDTSPLTSGVTISAASLFLYSQGDFAGDIGALSYMTVTEASPASNTTLTTDDYDQAGTIEVTNTHPACLTISLIAFTEFVFNATGLAFVSKTGYTPLGSVVGFDQANTAPTFKSDYTGVDWYSSRTTGTTYDPYLSVTYAAASGPTNVKTVNGLAIASVKTKDGLAIASIKSINGVT